VPAFKRNPRKGRGEAEAADALRLDEHDQGVGPHAVVGHSVGSRLGLHGRLEGGHVGNVGKDRRAVRVLRVEERSDADAQRPEELLSLR